MWFSLVLSLIALVTVNVQVQAANTIFISHRFYVEAKHQNTIHPHRLEIYLVQMKMLFAINFECHLGTGVNAARISHDTLIKKRHIHNNQELGN